MTATMPTTQLEAPPAPATRVAIARFFDRRRAEDAAAQIARRQVPEKAVQLTATGIRSTPPPTSHSSFWAAGMDGLRLGAILGVLFAAVWNVTGLASGDGGVIGFMLGAIIGALYGATAAVIGHWGESDPASGDDIFEADEFHLLVDERYEDAARAALRPARRNANGRFAGARP